MNTTTNKEQLRLRLKSLTDSLRAITAHDLDVLKELVADAETDLTELRILARILPLVVQSEYNTLPRANEKPTISEMVRDAMAIHGPMRRRQLVELGLGLSGAQIDSVLSRRSDIFFRISHGIYGLKGVHTSTDALEVRATSRNGPDNENSNGQDKASEPTQDETKEQPVDDAEPVMTEDERQRVRLLAFFKRSRRTALMLVEIAEQLEVDEDSARKLMDCEAFESIGADMWKVRV